MAIGKVVDYTDHTTYYSTFKYISVRLIILIAVKNVSVLMAGDIVNTFLMAPCAETFWSYCGVDSGSRCGAVVVLNRYLYGLKMASNSFRKYFGYFLRDL